MELKVVKSGAKSGKQDVDVSAFGDKVLYLSLIHI